MPSKLITGTAALLIAGTLAACGSSGSSSSATSSAGSRSTTTTTASVTTRAAAPVHGTTVTHKLAGTVGRKLTVADVRRFVIARRAAEHPHVSGMQGLSLLQKLNVSLSNLVPFWQRIFAQAGGQLPAGNAVLIQNQPVSCGSDQWTSSSPPGYCPATDTLLFPLGTITSNIAPLGDGAILLMTSDIFGYRVENALGAFQKSYTGAQLKEMDSCFSGAFFGYEAGALQPSDEQSVNNYLAQEAQAVGTAAGSGGVTAQDLSQAFNQGYTSVIHGIAHPRVCLPS